MRSFVIGDIHGQIKKLEEVFNLSGFDLNEDQLFCLGDLCDRGLYSKEVINLISKVKNLYLCVGNHDVWFIEYMMFGFKPVIWLEQGGNQTLDSFKGVKDFQKYIKFYTKARAYHINNNKFFSHAGCPDYLNEGLYDFIWDRSFARDIMSEYTKETFRYKYLEIYVGHTIVGDKPYNKGCVWLMDTGAGFDGPLTMMDIDSKQIYQSSNT